MTKFEGLQVGHRPSKRRFGVSAAEMRLQMEEFKRTGVHPALQDEGETTAAMPAEDAMRPRVYFVFERKDDGERVGAFREPVVVELFEDLVPAAAREFRLRCSGAGTGRLGDVSYEGSLVNKLWADQRIEAGASSAGDGKMKQTFPLEDHASLRHSEAGCVSMALHGTQFLVTLGPAPHLDGAWQIVGKVVSGLAAVRELAALPCTDDTCAPLRPVAIGLCGVLGGGGLEGALQVVLEMRAVQRQQQVDKANETPADVRARVCDSVKSAVQEALSVSQKRKADDAGAAGGGGLGLGGGGGAGAGGAAKKGGMWDALLGGGMDEEDLSDSEEEEEEEGAAAKKKKKE